MRNLNDLVIDRNNNFNLLRMVAASAVLFSHAYPISRGDGAAEPLSSSLQMSLGTLAVLTFFAISGFFISQSLDRRKCFTSFAAARALRIYPGLAAMLLLTILLVGPVFTTLSSRSYFLDRDTSLYFYKNLSLKWLQYDLPGVFHDNPYPATINGSLWTLFYEVACYGLVAAVAAFGLTARSQRFAIFLGIYAAFYVGFKFVNLPDHSLLANVHRLTLPFVLGMALYQLRGFVRLSAVLCGVSGLAALAAYGTAWFQEAFVVFWSYSIFYLGYLSLGPLKYYNRLGDYSYGMYIYAFPCEQIGAAVWKGISPIYLTAVAFPAALVCAILSWHLVESRALARRSAVGDWLQRKLASLQAPFDRCRRGLMDIITQL